MIRHVTVTTLLCCCLVIMTVAQTSTKEIVTKKGCSCAFSSINQVGVLTGEAGSSFQLQSINGMRYKTWFAGAGVGLDFYKKRGIPVFLDIRKDILNKPSTPFVYADGGIHYSWPTGQDKPGGNGKRTFSNDLYYDVGIGYKVSVKDQHAVLLSAGFSRKRVEEVTTYPQFCPACPPESYEAYNYTFNRLTLKLGYRF